MKHVFCEIDKKRPDLSSEQRIVIKESYARSRIHGIDINPDLARVAKMHMILYDDGHTGIFSENSLLSYEEIEETALAAEAGHIAPGTLELIFTNPPFGTKGKITSKRILEHSCMQSVKIFKGIQTKVAEKFLNEKISKFALAALGVNEPEHHRSIKKCLSCRSLSSCEYKIC